jgi:hypothetical protein
MLYGFALPGRLLAVGLFLLALAIDRPAAARDCTCDDLEARRALVDKEEAIYRDLHSEGDRWDSVAELNSEVGRRMGWTSTHSIGKGGGTATTQERKTAREQCLADGYCDWICDVSINGVHEQFHDWFDVQFDLSHLISRTILDHAQSYLQTSGQVPFHFGPTRWRYAADKILSEIAAHVVEKRFLEETIEQERAAGKCKAVDASPLKDELNQRFMAGRARLELFLKGLYP